MGVHAASILIPKVTTVDALHAALQEAAASLTYFDEASREWSTFHMNNSHPIFGYAWKDHQEAASRHGIAVKGLRGLRNAIQKEIAWLEKFALDTGFSKAPCPSSNASFLCTLWYHTLYSALHQAPVVEVDTSFPLIDNQSCTKKIKSAQKTTSHAKHGKVAKVDIVCNGGKQWIRIASIKPMSLLSEFRQMEADMIPSDISDEEADAMEPDEIHLESSIEAIWQLLRAGKLDSASSHCSLIAMGKELDQAGNVTAKFNSWGKPKIELVLSRLSFDDVSSLDSKFYNLDERDRYKARLQAIQKELARMGVNVSTENDRRLDTRTVMDGEALPRFPRPPSAKEYSPTSTINLDLSALIAFVSSISHMSLPTNEGDVEKLFSKAHWKKNQDHLNISEESEDDSIQHSRALVKQLQREMTEDSFFNVLTQPLRGQNPPSSILHFTCTHEAHTKMKEIVALVGGKEEQRRMQNLFDQNGGAYDLWKGSRWDFDGSHESQVRGAIALPVRINSLSDEQPSKKSNASFPFEKSFALDALNCAKEGIKSLSFDDGTFRRPIVHRQTRHTLSSMLIGLNDEQTTLTTNISSIKWLVKDIALQRAARGETPAYSAKTVREDDIEKPTEAAFWVMYPRSLAEKMIASTPAQTQSLISPIPINRNINHEVSPTLSSTESPLNGGSDKITTNNTYDTHHLGLPEKLSRSVPSILPGRSARLLRSISRWFTGPRPKRSLQIKHYKWWSLAKVEDTWSQWTARIAWKDPDHYEDSADICRPHNDIEHQEDSNQDQRDMDTNFPNQWWHFILKDIRINATHWLLLCLSFIGWALGFAFLVKSLWYESHVTSLDGSSADVSFFGCTTTLWSANSECGLNGEDCAPFSSNTSLAFRCPSNCQKTTLGGRRAVGDSLPEYVPLVIGGGNSNSSVGDESTHKADPFIYRGDSFICSAAIHAGVLSKKKGGCGSVWLSGTYSGFKAVQRNGIQSTSFNSTFPVSFFFDDEVASSKCSDDRAFGIALNVILLAWIGFLLRPKSIVYFYTLVCVGFWHINFISEPREYPMSVGEPMGDFLPTLFVAYSLWRLTFRFVWPPFQKLPLERNIWIQGFFWIGTMLDLVFANVPLNRLVASDISSQPGALTSLIIIVVVVLVLALNQIRVIRKVGFLPKYLTLAIIGGIIIGLLAAVPTTGLRLHHYIIALVLLPFCAFETRLSLIYSSFLLGMFLNGVGRWGFDGVIQDEAVIRGSAPSGSALPRFMNPSNWTGLSPYSDSPTAKGIVHWEPIPDNVTESYDSFQLLIDDVLRLQSSDTSFDLSLLPQYYLGSAAPSFGTSNNTDTDLLSSLSSALTGGARTNFSYYPGGSQPSNIVQNMANQPHYLRLAYYDSNTATVGDFTEAAVVWYNGTFVEPGPDAT